MKKIFTFILVLVCSLQVKAQITGDYQSAASGNWSAASTWQRHNGTSFVAAIVAPSNSDGVITIRTGHTVTVNSGITTDQTIVGTGGTLTITSTLTLNDGTGDDVMVNGALIFSGGTINGAGNMKINNSFNWQSGSINTGVQLASGSVSSKTTIGLADVNNAVLTNNGNFTWVQGNILLVNSGIFNNGVTGVITATGNDVMVPACCAVAFNNAGTFTKNTGTGITSINVSGSNSGTMNVNAGTIKSASSFANSGTINIATSNTFLVNDGIFSLNNGSISAGAGNFQISAGTITVNAAAATPATAANYLFTGGTMNGTGTLNVTGGMEWQTGSMQSAKVHLIAGSVSSKTTTGLADVNNAVLTNNGNFTWVQGNIQLGNFGIFNNGATGVITATGNDVMVPACCVVAFNNAGTFAKTSGTGTTTLGVATTNTGIIKGIGTLNFTSTFTSNGIIAPGTSPGLLTINGSQPLSANSTLQIEMQSGNGPGTGHDQLIRAGNITLAGTLTVTETGVVPLGTYTIINLTLGTISGSFSTVNLPPGYILQVNATNVQIIRNVILPLTLISFSGQKTADNEKIILKWITSNEINTSHFTVEKSTDARVFEAAGTVTAIGNSRNNYSFVSAVLNGNPIYYYRLKINDKDGRFTYSPVIKFSFQPINSFSVFPNPAQEFITISNYKKQEIIIVNIGGQVMSKIKLAQGSQTINISSWPSGTYLLKGQDEVIKIIKK